MALQYVGGTSGSGTSTGYTISLSGTLTGGLASSPSAGDIVIVASAFGNNASSAPAVSGNTSGAYTGAHTALYSNDTWDTNFRAFYMVQGSTPDTTLTITRVTNAAYGGATVVHVWRGVDTASPLDQTTTTTSASNQSASTINPPSITPNTSGAVVIACGAGTQGTAGSAFTIPSGMTNGVSVKADGTTSDIGVMIASFAWTSGPYDPAAVTGGTTSTSSSWAAATLALKPFVAVTHATTGELTGQGASVAGTAQHNVPHSTSGTLTGQGAEIVGSADRTASVVDHVTSGTLVGQGAAVSGSAARFRAFSTSGTLTGQGAAVTGSAQHNVPHSTTGTLTGQGSSVSGSAARFRAFATTGELTGQGAAINGSASRSTGPVTHATSGTLTGQGSAVTGSAARFRALATSGSLIGQGATVTGSANRIAAPVSHATSGALVGQGSEVVGSGLRYRQLASSGALVGQGATVEGTASRVHEHYTSGELTGQGSAIVGSADLLHIVKTHETSGELVGQGAVISAEVGNGLKPSGCGSLSAIKKARKAAEEARLKAAEAERLKNEAITAEILAPKPVPVDYVAIEQESRRTKRKVEAARIQAEQAIAQASEPIEPLPSVNSLLISEQISSTDHIEQVLAMVSKPSVIKESLTTENDDDDALALIMILAEMD